MERYSGLDIYLHNISTVPTSEEVADPGPPIAEGEVYTATRVYNPDWTRLCRGRISVEWDSTNGRSQIEIVSLDDGKTVLAEPLSHPIELVPGYPDVGMWHMNSQRLLLYEFVFDSRLIAREFATSVKRLTAKDETLKTNMYRLETLDRDNVFAQVRPPTWEQWWYGQLAWIRDQILSPLSWWSASYTKS